LTKIIDISFADNRALSTIQRNAIMSKRSNQLKSQHFQLDLIVGKLFLTNHPNFSQEERLMNQLKKLLKEYKVYRTFKFNIFDGEKKKKKLRIIIFYFLKGKRRISTNSSFRRK
jgi:hypothetical protein